MSNVSLVNGHIDEVKDLVEVVRCKDCKHCEHFYSSCDYDGNTTEEYYCNAFKGAMKPTDFCSYGERRGKEE